MSQRIEVSPIGLVNRYHQDFPSQVNFKTDQSGTLIEGRSSQNFTNSRVNLIDCYISGQRPKTEMPQALLAEELVRIAVKNPLEERGFFLHLAPQNFESGKNQKGVDLIIVDNNDMICLGVDLKLKKGRSRFNRDGFGWSPKLHSPYIYLTMGNWSLETREESHVSIRKWISEYTCPKLRTSGKIPHIQELRRYIITRIEKSLSGYIEMLKEPIGEFANITIPESQGEVSILEDKLFTLHLLFSSLNDQYLPKTS